MTWRRRSLAKGELRCSNSSIATVRMQATSRLRAHHSPGNHDSHIAQQFDNRTKSA
jgi:hypothetical protein